MGSAALTVAVATALLWTLASVVQRIRPAQRFLSVATATSASVAVLLLGRALLVVDPELRYVQEHSSTATPVAYRVAGLWGGMEGSLLVWSFMVVVVAVISRRWSLRHAPTLLRGVEICGAALSTAFLATSRLVASPFDTLAIPTGSGRGLLAVLQHPAMVYHPPLLYTGLVLLCVPFGLTASAVWQRRIDRTWADAVTPWLRSSWIVLGIGMLTGSHWAYAELGWGGIWAWDPVENAALLPWLATTIALHSTIVVRRDGSAGATSAGAVGAAFVLMTVGVYVTRSGGTGSIHAFAESPDVGRALLALSTVIGVLTLVGLARLRPHAVVGRTPHRAQGLLAPSWLLGTAVLGIALGTFLPVFDDVFGGRRSVVAPRYYERFLPAILVLVLAAMAMGPSLRWSGGIRRRARLGSGALVGAGMAALVATTIGGRSTIGVAGIVVIVAGASIGATATSARLNWRSCGVAAAHAGFALMMAAAAASSFGTESRVSLVIGETAPIDGGTIELLSLDSGVADRYEYVRATVQLEDGSAWVHLPELRAYEDQRLPTAEADIRVGLLGDTIVVLESLDERLDGATLTVLTRPLLSGVWVGAAMMMAGGSIVLFAGRRRTLPSGSDGTRSRSATAAPRPASAAIAATSSTDLR